jgi:2-oxoglutarate ferredoxin oxidoreductase subunit delta
MTDKKSLVQNLEWCKGCGICAEFCPNKVIEIKNDKAFLAYPDSCIFCGQCELRCPDNAIYILGGNADEQ